MVVLDVADEEMPRLVVEKLRPAVEERRVVLVPLQDERGAGAPPIAAPQVLHLSTDQEPGVAPGVEQQPGGQRRSRGLAVGPRHHDRGLLRQEVLPDGLWHREDGDLPPVRLGGLDVVAERGVPHDDAVAAGGHVFGRKPPRDRNLEGVEQRGHRRIQVECASRDAVPLLGEERGERRHGRASDRHEVDGFRFRHGPRKRRESPAKAPDSGISAGQPEFDGFGIL